MYNKYILQRLYQLLSGNSVVCPLNEIEWVTERTLILFVSHNDGLI